MTDKTLLLSIRPQYASKIFDGEKRVELRKVRPRHLSQGDKVLVYVSSPTKELQGMFTVDSILEATPEDLWSQVQNTAGITKQEFDDYYSGSTKGFGIFLKIPRTLDNPISLFDLRKLWENFHPPQFFHPPQSYRYLTNVELNRILHNPIS